MTESLRPPEAPQPLGRSRQSASVERSAFGLPGVPALLLWLLLAAANAFLFLFGGYRPHPLLNVLSWGVGFVLFWLLGGFFVVQPNQARVLTLFGRYVGTERRIFLDQPAFGQASGVAAHPQL